jgi:transcriptional regulator with XRE-family HTH domain
MKSPDHQPTDFGRALRAARAAKNLSQEHFVEVTSQTHISRLERGTKLPNFATVEELAKAMDLHPLVLFVLSYLPDPTASEVKKLLLHIEKQVDQLKLKQQGD